MAMIGSDSLVGLMVELGKEGKDLVKAAKKFKKSK